MYILYIDIQVTIFRGRGEGGGRKFMKFRILSKNAFEECVRRRLLEPYMEASAREKCNFE